MTVLLECKNLFKEYGDIKMFDNASISIKVGEKLGLVGTNGTGKTTLANIIIGTEEVQGNIKWFKDNIRIGYMKQATDYVEGYDKLSGGEKTKKLLRDVIYGDYDMLILDEPTNNLDYVGVKWLIDIISKSKQTILIISHDRYFLDKCVKRIVEIKDRKFISYNGNYTLYRKKKKSDYEDKMHQYLEQEKRKAQINAQIDELKKWSAKGHRDSTKKALTAGCKMGVKEFYRAKVKKKDKQVKSKIKKLEKINNEGINKPREEETIVFNIEKSNKVGNVIVRAKDISKAYDKKVIFEKSSFYIKGNEKIGLYGVNGSGKTTLIKALLQEIQVEGDLYIRDSKIGYISQDVIGLDEDVNILELFHVNNRKELGDIITKLNLMGFAKEDLDKKIKVLSLGERMKLKILLMINSNCDILILDEPTNHIDIHVREQLEEALVNYKGTIILVTHDRYMLENVCNKLLVFKDRKIVRYEYGINEYLEKKDIKKNYVSNEDKILLDTKISCILGKLSLCQHGSEEYFKLDKEYKELIKLKNSWYNQV